MHIESVTQIYFSPTKTTRKIVESIARGVDAPQFDYIDLTPPDALKQQRDIDGGLAVIGSPVYAGRLPNDMISRLKRVKGNGTPAVIIVVFGNRAYDDALLELRDLALETGFKPFAAGAFIGEHSFSTGTTPIAVGRPDGEDVKKAEKFGKMIQGGIKKLAALDVLAPIQVPGKFPYKERSGLSGVTPATDETFCAKCEACALVCPKAAITVRDTVLTDPSECIRCCACVKACVSGARTMNDTRLRQIAENLSINCRARKEPEVYI